MSDNSAILGLPYIQPGQAQKHVTHNEALSQLDVLVQLRVSGFDAVTPPAAPVEGEVHALGVNPTGAWAGQAATLAAWLDGNWTFVPLQEGWRGWNSTGKELRIWDGAAWVRPLTEMDNLSGVGINASSDATNRLSVNSDAILFNHAGSGSQAKVNKATVADDAGFVFQDAFSTRALFGLLANDDFTLKVSPDGSVFHDAMVVDKDSGASGFLGIEATPIGQTTPDAGAFTTLSAAAAFSVSSIVPRITLFDTDGTPGVEGVTLVNNNGVLTVQSRTLSDAFVATEYQIGLGATGAIFHRWYLAGAAVGVWKGSGLGVGTLSPVSKLHVEDDAADTDAARIKSSSAAFTDTTLKVICSTSGSSTFDLARFYSGNGGDTEFRFAGDGNGTCDGAWTGGGADYAEYFEWADGNPQAEDRRGISVVLDGDRIREAVAGEDPIGAISGHPSMIGDGDVDRWKGKYLRDDFGTAITEDHEVVEWIEKVVEDSGEVDADGNPITIMRDVPHSHAADAMPDGVVVPNDATRHPRQRRLVNPDYDAAAPYTPRAERAEWDTVGLMGKLRIRKGQVTGARWVRMREISAGVEEWLVR